MQIQKQKRSDGIVKILMGLELSDAGLPQGNVELDIESQAHFVEVMNEIFEESGLRVIVDMTNVSYIDSSGLWALFEGHKKAVQKSSRLVLLNTAKDVRRVLDITKMSSKIQIFATEDEAVASLQ